MIRAFRDRVALLFRRSSPPLITEDSALRTIALHYPSVYAFVERRYGIKIDTIDKQSSLKQLSANHGLPPAQIIFMEIQLNERAGKVRFLSPREAKRLMDSSSRYQLLDVREEWETHLARIPHARMLTPPLLDQLLAQIPKTTPILLFCHFGIRSLDAATFLTDRGFTEVFVLKGGIDGWAKEIDPSVPTYQNAWC